MPNHDEEDITLSTTVESSTLCLSYIKSFCFSVNQQTIVPAGIQIILGAGASFVYGSALTPPEAYGPWAVVTVVAGAYYQPIARAVELISERDPFATLRAEIAADRSMSDSRRIMIGLTKILGKQVIVPFVPVSLIAYGLAGPDKQLGHPLVPVLVHTTAGFLTRFVTAQSLEHQFPAHQPDAEAKLTGHARTVQRYVIEPLAVGTRMMLLAEFVRQTDLDPFRLEERGLHAPILFGFLFLLGRIVRQATASYRELLGAVTFEQEREAKALEMTEQKAATVATPVHSADGETALDSIPDSFALNLRRNSFNNLLSLDEEAKKDFREYSDNLDRVNEMGDSHLDQIEMNTAASKHTAKNRFAYCANKTKQAVLTGCKIAVIWAGGFAGNALCSMTRDEEDTAHLDDSMGDRMQRYSYVACGMDAASLLVEGAEKLWQNRATLFGRQRSIDLPTGRQPLLSLTSDPEAKRQHNGL